MVFLQYNLGLMHGEGKGINKDYITAAKWYSKAAEQGHVKARDILAKTEEKSKYRGELEKAKLKTKSFFLDRSLIIDNLADLLEQDEIAAISKDVHIPSRISIRQKYDTGDKGWAGFLESSQDNSFTKKVKIYCFIDPNKVTDKLNKGVVAVFNATIKSYTAGQLLLFCDPD